MRHTPSSSSLPVAEPASARDICTELRALEINGDLKARGSTDHHVLVASDAYQGSRVARLLEGWLARYRSVERIEIGRLVPPRLLDFRANSGKPCVAATSPAVGA